MFHTAQLAISETRYHCHTRDLDDMRDRFTMIENSKFVRTIPGGCMSIDILLYWAISCVHTTVCLQFFESCHTDGAQHVRWQLKSGQILSISFITTCL